MVNPSVLWVGALTVGLVHGGPLAASAQAAHGRLDGDLAYALHAGAGLTFGEDSYSGAALVELRARYLDTAGIVIGVEARPEGSRVLLLADLRPLFLIRFFLGAMTGSRWLDVLIDSVNLDLGVAILPLDERVGAALAVGFGLDLPLAFFSEVHEGISLRLFGRHVTASASDRYGPSGGRSDWVGGVAMVLYLQTRTGLPAWAPARYALP